MDVGDDSAWWQNRSKMDECVVTVAPADWMSSGCVDFRD